MMTTAKARQRNRMAFGRVRVQKQNGRIESGRALLSLKKGVLCVWIGSAAAGIRTDLGSKPLALSPIQSNDSGYPLVLLTLSTSRSQNQFAVGSGIFVRPYCIGSFASVSQPFK